MASQQEIEVALAYSTDCLRMAEQKLRDYAGMPVVADMLRKQLEHNMALLFPPGTA